MRPAIPALLSFLLAGCGGGVGGGAQLAPVMLNGASVDKLEPQVFGALLEAVQLGTTRITGEPKCAISTYRDANLLRSGHRSGFLADFAAHPCNASTADPLQCAPTHALRKLVARNDVRNYHPAVPLMLCGANGDPTVPYQNTVSALAYFRASAVSELDLDTVPGLSGDWCRPFAWGRRATSSRQRWPASLVVAELVAVNERLRVIFAIQES